MYKLQIIIVNVLIDPGLLTYDDFLEINTSLNENHKIGVLVNKKKFPDWHPNNTRLQTWTYEQLEDVNTHFERTPYHDHYESVLSIILKDSRTFYLIERLFRGSGLDSVFNNVVKVEKIVWNSLAILYSFQPERMVFINTPHNTSWFIAKTAELIGVDIYFTAISPLPWKIWVVKDLDRQIPVKMAQLDTSERETSDQAIINYIRDVRSSYQGAMPEYEKKRMNKYKGTFFSYRLEIGSILSKNNITSVLTSKSPISNLSIGILSKLNSTIKKKRALTKYSEYSNKYIQPNKYVVFFLHFQPERTTLPDGLNYAQQWLAIRTLSEAIPSNYHLVVKEHPSTFRNIYDPNVRDTKFYAAINALPNVSLAPLELSPFQLIDNSIAVSTITGTVGIEALIRGKPVIVFGTAQYRGAKGVYFVKSIGDVREIIQKNENGFEVMNDNELVEYFSKIDINSFFKNKRINSSVKSYRIAITQDINS